MRGVPYEMIECAAIGHSWEPATAIHRTLSSRTLLVSCTSCGSERVDDLAPDGTVTYRKYDQSAQYRKFLDGPFGGLPRADYRMELLRRVRRSRSRMEGAA